MAKRKNGGNGNGTKQVDSFKHKEAHRKNIPSAEHEAVLREHERTPVQVAYERRNRDLDPQLVWRGKDQQDWSDLVVQADPRSGRPAARQADQRRGRQHRGPPGHDLRVQRAASPGPHRADHRG